MDPAGWADVNEVKKILKLSEAKLQELINNNKTRFQLRDGLIRASQGHSLSGTRGYAVWPGGLMGKDRARQAAVAWNRCLSGGGDRIERPASAKEEYVHLASSIEAT